HSNSSTLNVYSGSVSGNDSATDFRDTNRSRVTFYSFVQSDDVILKRFCNYLASDQLGFNSQKPNQPEFDFHKLAILSEDETAYGKSVVKDETAYGKSVVTDEAAHGKSEVPKDCSQQAVSLFYPRDISALRGAYQTKSLFGVAGGAAAPDSQRRNLPSDLADPAGKVHDSIRAYAGNQAPLVQEAFLLEIVAVLRDLHARYILLRGTNVLDQLFLANFLRRMYPDGRIVILSADLLFIRE